MQYAISIFLSGISLGGQYALIAIGYTLVYGILRLINFAHGDVFMVADTANNVWALEATQTVK